MSPQLIDYIRVYDDGLPREFCAQLVEGFERTVAEQRRSGRGVLPGLEGSAWTELDLGQIADKAFLGFFLAKVDEALERYNLDVRLTIPVPLRPRTDRLILKRYRAGGEDQFQPHFDSIDGETEFCDIGMKVGARAGRLLMFPPYWMFQHAGLPPRSGDKYILSTYLMF
jgi:prolyl 4-hydroxylase